MAARGNLSAQSFLALGPLDQSRKADIKQLIEGRIRVTTKKSGKLSIVGASTGIQPPRQLGDHGLALWKNIMSEYALSNSGGLEILAQACAALDRAEELAAQIDEDGATVLTKDGTPKEHPCLKGELSNRAFLCRCLTRLGLNVESVRPVGRPPRGTKRWSRCERRSLQASG